MVIVLDFGGQYNQLVARRVRECNVYCEIYSYRTDIEKIKAMNPKGIILTGGPNSCYEPDSPTYTEELFKLGVPVLGLCYGAYVFTCKFALAGKKGSNFYEGYGIKTIATKYPEVTRAFFENKGMDIDIVKIEGSVELAPLVGLADAIVDIVETGTTLKENGLEVWEDVAPISARLIVNTVSMKLKQQRIAEIVKQIEENL